jgi:hypothetical protein
MEAEYIPLSEEFNKTQNTTPTTNTTPTPTTNTTTTPTTNGTTLPIPEPSEPAKPAPIIVKKYLKVIKSNINVRKFGIGSSIGNVTYSSIFNTSFLIKNITVDPKLGWKSLNNVTNESVGLVFPNDTKIERVVIQVGENNSYPTEFFIEYTNSTNDTFTRVPTPITLTDAPINRKVFDIAPITAKIVRLVITKYVKWPAMKFDLLFTDENCNEDNGYDETIDLDPQVEYDGRVILSRRNETDKDDYIRTYKIQPWEELPIDLLNLIRRFNETRYVNDKGLLPISKISVLTYSSIKSPENINYTLDKVGWAAKTNNPDEFAGVITPFPVNVTEIQIRPTDDGSFPTEVDIEYREALTDPSYKKLTSSPVKITNFSSNGIATIPINNIRVSEVKIIVKSYNKWPAMRFEITYTDPSYLVYLEAAKKIKNELRSRSVADRDEPVTEKGAPTSSGSLLGFEDPTSPKGWKGSINKPGYVGIKFPSFALLSGIRVINPNNGDVENFTVAYFDPNSHNIVKNITNGELTTDENGVRTFRFGRLIKALEIRIYVDSFKSWPAVRLELFRTLGSVWEEPEENPNDSVVRGGQIVSSGSVRGYENPAFTENDGWKSTTNNTDVYIGRRFDQATQVSGVKLTNGFVGDVKDFIVQYSEASNPTSFKDIRISEGKLTKDSRGIRIFRFGKTISVKEIRVVVKSFKTWPGLKLDFYVSRKQALINGSQIIAPAPPPTNVAVNTAHQMIVEESPAPSSTYQGTPASADEFILDGTLLTSGAATDYDYYGFEKLGWKSAKNQTGVFAGLQLFNNAVMPVSEARVTGDASNLTFQYYDSSSSTELKTAVPSEVVEKGGVSSYIFNPAIRAHRFQIVVGGYKSWPSFKFLLLTTTQYETVVRNATFVSSGSAAGFEASLVRENGWKSSTKNSTSDIYAGYTWKNPVRISILRISNPTIELGYKSFKILSKADANSDFEEIPIKARWQYHGYSVIPLNIKSTVEVRLLFTDSGSNSLGAKFDLMTSLGNYTFGKSFGAAKALTSITVSKVNGEYPPISVEYKNEAGNFVCYNSCKWIRLSNESGGKHNFETKFETKEVKMIARALDSPGQPIWQ